MHTTEYSLSDQGV